MTSTRKVLRPISTGLCFRLAIRSVTLFWKVLRPISLRRMLLIGLSDLSLYYESVLNVDDCYSFQYPSLRYACCFAVLLSGHQYDYHVWDVCRFERKKCLSIFLCIVAYEISIYPTIERAFPSLFYVLSQKNICPSLFSTYCHKRISALQLFLSFVRFLVFQD